MRREGLFKFRNDPLKRQPFENLSTDAQSRADIYAQGNAARAAWEQADPAWTYAQDVTVGSLGSLLANSFTHQQTNTRKETAWRNAAAALMTKAGALDVDNMAWYAAATRRFAAGTTEGDMIRVTVPTTTRPEAAVGQAVISNLMVSGSDIHFDAAAEHATRYTYLHQAPGSSVFLVAVADTPSSAFTLHGQAPGAHKFKVIGSNASSQGEESAAVEATVAQAAVA